jgi:SNF2 family DNA or RNA helicase
LLYPYQAEGVEFLKAEPRRYLADDMGLGKTPQAIVAAQQLGVKHPLVICPASAVENWRREWHKWWDGAPRLAAISYSRLLRRWQDVQRADWDLVILDEAHYVKTVSAKRSLRALNIAKAVERAWLLSGTPMPNDPSELWSPIKKLWPELPASIEITTAWQWYVMFCKYTSTAYGPRAYAVNNPEVLKGFLKQIMLRRTWDDVDVEIPPLRVDTHYLDRDPKFADALEAMAEEAGGMNYVMEAQDEDPHVSRLRRFLGEYKGPKIAKQISDELADRQYKQIVVLAYHIDTISSMHEAFKKNGLTVTGFTGKHSPKARQMAIDLFTDGDADVFLAQSGAAGEAINLQVAHEIVLVEPAWSPKTNSQAIKRIHRIGQEHPCRARVFAVPGTLDDAIMGVIAQKTQMQVEVGL